MKSITVKDPVWDELTKSKFTWHCQKLSDVIKKYIKIAKKIENGN